MSSTIALTAAKAHYCSTCQPERLHRGVPVIARGYLHLRHVSYPGNTQGRPVTTRECISCANERDDFTSLLAGACATSCHGHSLCALPLGHGGSHSCSHCGRLEATAQAGGWRPVPGYDALATASGDIRGPSGKVLKHYVCPRGYRHVLIRHRKLAIHHAVLLAFGFERPPGAECRHLDGDPGNNSLGNLRWGTSAENAADRLGHGRTGFGEDGSAARLTTEQVLAIKRDSRSSRLVGRDYGVAHTTVLQIRRGNTWSVALERSGLLNQESAA